MDKQINKDLLMYETQMNKTDWLIKMRPACVIDYRYVKPLNAYKTVTVQNSKKFHVLNIICNSIWLLCHMIHITTTCTVCFKSIYSVNIKTSLLTLSTLINIVL